MKNVTQPATTFVTVILTVIALAGPPSAAVPNVAARQMLARSPSSLLDATAGRGRLLTIHSARDSASQEAARRRVVS